jgi:hypothetical protein
MLPTSSHAHMGTNLAIEYIVAGCMFVVGSVCFLPFWQLEGIFLGCILFILGSVMYIQVR